MTYPLRPAFLVTDTTNTSHVSVIFVFSSTRNVLGGSGHKWNTLVPKLRNVTFYCDHAMRILPANDEITPR